MGCPGQPGGGSALLEAGPSLALLTSCCVCHSNGSPALCYRPSCILPWNPRATGVWTPPPALGPGCFAGKLSKWVPQPLQPPSSLSLRIYYSDFPTKGLIFCSSCDSPLLECIAVRHRSLRRGRAGRRPSPSWTAGSSERPTGQPTDAPSPAPRAASSFCQDSQTPSSGEERPCSARHRNPKPEPAGGSLSPSPRNPPPRAQQPVSRYS